jgi:hypothetical protein
LLLIPNVRNEPAIDPDGARLIAGITAAVPDRKPAIRSACGQRSVNHSAVAGL